MKNIRYGQRSRLRFAGGNVWGPLIPRSCWPSGQGYFILLAKIKSDHLTKVLLIIFISTSQFEETISSRWFYSIKFVLADLKSDHLVKVSNKKYAKQWKFWCLNIIVMKIAQKYQGRGKQYPIDNLFDVKSNWYWNDIKDGYINTCEGCDKGRRATSCFPLSLQVGWQKK